VVRRHIQGRAIRATSSPVSPWNPTSSSPSVREISMPEDQRQAFLHLRTYSIASSDLADRMHWRLSEKILFTGDIFPVNPELSAGIRSRTRWVLSRCRWKAPDLYAAIRIVPRQREGVPADHLCRGDHRLRLPGPEPDPRADGNRERRASAETHFAQQERAYGARHTGCNSSVSAMASSIFRASYPEDRSSACHRARHRH